MINSRLAFFMYFKDKKKGAYLWLRKQRTPKRRSWKII